MDIANTATGNRGIAATGDAHSARAALSILDNGGNASDAAAAALLVLGVTNIGATCLGGEVPIIVYDNHSAGIAVIAGQGAAPADENAIAWYLRHGWGSSAITAATVPALLDACITLLSSHGTLSFEAVAQPVLELLGKGRPSWYTDTALRKNLDALTGKEFADAGTLPAGTSLWSTHLATTLKKLVWAEQRATGTRRQRLNDVRDLFYRGDIARALAEWYADTGAFLRAEDLFSHSTPIEQPVIAGYRGHQIHKCGTWTQGPWMLQALKVLEGCDLATMGATSADYIHVVTEAMKLSMADRDHYYGDPRFADVPLSELLSDDYARLRRDLILQDRSIARPLPGDPRRMRSRHDQPGTVHSSTSGTTVCIVADRHGNVVVATPSGVGSTAGSGGTTGITHGTRLHNFNRIAGHPNCIGPGKRPRVTLSPTLVTKNGKPVLALSVTSGDLQDQVALQRVIDFVDFNRSIYESARTPRFYTGQERTAGGQKDAREYRLHVQSQIGSAIVEELLQRGHRARATSIDVSQAAVSIDPGTLVAHAAGDFCGAL